MDRMGPLDAAFLQGEDEEPGVSLAMGSIAVFEGPAPTTEEYAALVAGRLPLVPRYRQKAREVPLDLGPPVWVDDPDFDLSYHLRRTALPAPGGDRELADLMGRVMSDRLDRDRPLWENWLVEGLANGHWAVITKIHHCLVDGIAGTDLYRVLLDPTPEPGPGVADDWRPRPEPSRWVLAAAAAADLARLPARQARALAGAARTPGRLVLQAAAAVRGLAALATALRPAPASSLTGPPTAHRRFAFARTTIRDVATVRHGLGGTFNDVVLAAVTAAYRRLLLTRGELPTARTVRTLVPVSVRPPGTADVRDNEVSLMLADLPVHLADPAERLVAVRHQLTALKERHEAEAGSTVVQVAAHEPFPLVALAVRLSARLRQRFVVTVATDVPGPREPFYALGRRLVELVPYVPIASTLRLGVAILSYCDGIAVGVTGDAHHGADVEVLARGFEEGMRELVDAVPVDARTPVAPAPSGGRRG